MTIVNSYKTITFEPRFYCSGRFCVVVRVVVHLCVVLDANASIVMHKNEIPRQTGIIFSCQATRIPRRLPFTLRGKSFML